MRAPGEVLDMVVAEDQRGSLAPLVAVLVLVAGGLVVGMGRLGEGAVAAARARTAADAAALAGAAQGREAAEDVADANGGRLEAYSEDGGDTRVEVSVGRARASAKARSGLGAGFGAGIGASAGRRSGLAPAMLAALGRAERLLGAPVPVTSGLRSSAQQAALYARRGSNPYPVAAPGTSKHELGLAVDVPSGFAPRLAGVASSVGLCRPYPAADPVHFEVC